MYIKLIISSSQHLVSGDIEANKVDATMRIKGEPKKMSAFEKEKHMVMTRNMYVIIIYQLRSQMCGQMGIISYITLASGS